MIKNSLYQADLNCVLKTNCNWLQLKNKTILITGASGQIGTVLVDLLLLLDKKYDLNIQLVLLSRSVQPENNHKNVQWIQHDINEPLHIEKKIDFVIHGASNTHPLQYSKFPVETITTNVFGTYNLLKLCCLNPGSRFVLLSSVEIYGEGDHRFSENDSGYIDCNIARNGYNESKRLCEALCQSYKAEHNVDFVTARLCRIYGPTLKKDDSKALSQFLRNGLNGKDIVLKSEGKQFYSYLYSIDAAIAVLLLMVKGESGQAYNVSENSSDCYLKDLAALIAEKTGTSVIFDLPSEEENKGFSKATMAVLDSSKLQNLGWKAFFNIETGIDHTLQIMK